MTIKHINIKVIGKVQGVFFRKYTKQKAVELGVNGMVRNDSDGSVYIEAEADESILGKFIAWCKIGSPASKVESCHLSEGEIKNYKSFEIHG